MALTPRDLTDVSIQPSASPISLNVLPAPGQTLRGNNLQQLGEALAAFSPSLNSMLSRRVEEDKRMLAAQGASVDFSKVLDVQPGASLADREAALNSAFKDAIAKDGGPDSANPFFLIAAKQNFGRAVGLRYRNALASLSDKATDPDNPVAFGDIAKEAAEMAGASSATSDVYGASGFASVAQEANAEFNAKFTAELRKRQDFLAIERTQQGIADAIVTAAVSDGQWTPESPVWQAAQQSIDSIQLTSSDPETARKTLVGASVVAFSQIKDPDDLDEAMSAMSKLRFGTAEVMDNPALFMEIVRRKDARMDEIINEGTRREALVTKQVQRWEREASAKGFNERISRAVLDGTPEKAQQALDSILDQIITENPDITAVVRDELRAKMQKNLTSLAQSVQYSRNTISDRAFTDTFNLIDEGVIDDAEILRLRMDDLRIPTEQQVQLRKYFNENVGIVRSASSYYTQTKGKEIVGRVMQGMVAAGMAQPDASGSMKLPMSKQDEAQQYEVEWREQSYKHVQDYVRGLVRDPSSGKTYAEIKTESGIEAANRSINGVLDSFYDSQLKGLNDQFRAEREAASAGIRMGTAQPTDSFMAEVAVVQKNVVDAIATGIESQSVPVEEQEKSIVDGMADQIADVKTVGAEVGFGYGRAYDPEILADHLGDMWKVASTNGAASVNRLGYVWDTSVKFTPDAVLQRYGKVKRSAAVGLNPDEVIMNETSEGLPVFGVVLPRKQDAVEYAFSVPMFVHQWQITDPDMTAEVMDALGLPADRRIREAFIARQATLLRIRQTMQGQVDPARKVSPIN